MNNYYVQYKITKTDFKGSRDTREFRTYKSTPVIALNEFHRSMQRTKEVDAKRKVTRPRLRPDEYEISRLFLRYNGKATELATSGTVESDFDLPNTPNPDLKQTKKVKKADRPKPPEFSFMSESSDLKLS